MAPAEAQKSRASTAATNIVTMAFCIIPVQDVSAPEETVSLCLRGVLGCSGIFRATAYRKGTKHETVQTG